MRSKQNWAYTGFHNTEAMPLNLTKNAKAFVTDCGQRDGASPAA